MTFKFPLSVAKEAVSRMPTLNSLFGEQMQINMTVFLF